MTQQEHKRFFPLPPAARSFVNNIPAFRSFVEHTEDIVRPVAPPATRSFTDNFDEIFCEENTDAETSTELIPKGEEEEPRDSVFDQLSRCCCGGACW